MKFNNSFAVIVLTASLISVASADQVSMPKILGTDKSDSKVTLVNDPDDLRFAYLGGAFALTPKIKLERERIEQVYRPEMVVIPASQPFLMSKTEVTQEQWYAVMGYNPSNNMNCANCPVERVSWDGVQIYLNKLNAKTGRKYRLPTEIEWEFACYGGKKTKYCGGDDLNSVGWYYKNSGGASHPVGQKQANGYGLYDMSGNVSEWVMDCYDPNEVVCSMQVLRGGGVQEVSTADFRKEQWSSWRDINSYYGFRIARTLR